jgi:excisionase family DNA binding protein
LISVFFFLSVAILVLLQKGEIMIATPLLTAKDIARLLKISNSHAYKLVSSGQLKAIKFNRTVRIRQEDLDAFLQSNMTEDRGVKK